MNVSHIAGEAYLCERQIAGSHDPYIQQGKVQNQTKLFNMSCDPAIYRVHKGGHLLLYGELALVYYGTS